jgi:hypothetical protein
MQQTLYDERLCNNLACLNSRASLTMTACDVKLRYLLPGMQLFFKCQTNSFNSIDSCLGPFTEHFRNENKAKVSENLGTPAVPFATPSLVPLGAPPCQKPCVRDYIMLPT